MASTQTSVDVKRLLSTIQVLKDTVPMVQKTP